MNEILTVHGQNILLWKKEFKRNIPFYLSLYVNSNDNKYISRMAYPVEQYRQPIDIDAVWVAREAYQDARNAHNLRKNMR